MAESRRGAAHAETTAACKGVHARGGDGRVPVFAPLDEGRAARLVFRDPATNSYKFQFQKNGEMFASTYSTSSDDRLKHNEESLTTCCATIQKLKPKKYIKTDMKDASGE